MCTHRIKKIFISTREKKENTKHDARETHIHTGGDDDVGRGMGNETKGDWTQMNLLLTERRA